MFRDIALFTVVCIVNYCFKIFGDFIYLSCSGLTVKLLNVFCTLT